MYKRKLPTGFIVPAQPVKAHRPPMGPNWVHEIKHDGYRLIVRKDGTTVRLFTRNGCDWTERFPVIAAAAARLKAQSFIIDGEATVIGSDGLSRFDDLRRRESARTAILYAFDLIERDTEDMRVLTFLDRKGALAQLLASSNAGILLNEHVAADGPTVFEHACRLGAEGIVSKRIDAPYRSGPCPTWVKVRNPTSIAVQRERSENWNR
jgi:bifunctional non-homologous end joining protein LigD